MKIQKNLKKNIHKHKKIYHIMAFKLELKCTPD